MDYPQHRVANLAKHKPDELVSFHQGIYNNAFLEMGGIGKVVRFYGLIIQEGSEREAT